MTDVRFCGTAFCIVDLMGDIEAPDRETERRAQEKQKEITFQNGVDVRDAIGISSKVAERLSGADFDGDTVMAIPMSDKVRINSTDPLPGLKSFDPKTSYAVPEGNPNNVRLMKKDEKQKEMGIISNLITDMTLRGAPPEDLERAVRHSMVVMRWCLTGLWRRML